MNRLKELREKQGLSANALATAIGVSHTTILRAEKGQRKLSIPQAQAVASYFHVSIDYLLGASVEEMYTNFVSSYAHSFIEFSVDKNASCGYQNISPEMGIKIGILRYLQDINDISDLSRIFETVSFLHQKLE